MVMKGKVYVMLADGFEEMDVSVVTCSLRGLGLPVAVVGLKAGPVRGAHGLSLMPDCTLSEVDRELPQAAVLPGGVQAAVRFSAEPRVHTLLRQVTGGRGYVMVIDTARAVLRSAGISANGEAKVLPSGRVLVKGHVIVSQDSGAAEEAALTLASML